MYTNVNKDNYYNKLLVIDNNKIPIYESISLIDNEPGLLGTIIVESSSGRFCWHDGIEWVCTNGSSGSPGVYWGQNIGGGLPANPLNPILPPSSPENNVGDVYYTVTGTVMQFRRLISPDNSITINTLNSPDPRIELTSNIVESTAQNVGSGSNIYVNGSGPNPFQFKTLLPGSNVNFIVDSSTITINSIGGSGTGSINNGDNIGGGDGEIFSGVNGNVLEFRTLEAESGISITTDILNEIVSISNIINGSNLGSSNGIFTSRNGNNLDFKTLVAGTNVVINELPNALVINSTGSINDGSNIGLGSGEIFSGINVNTLEFRTLAQESGISITTDIPNDTVSISNTINGSNLGGANNIFINRNGSNLEFRTLKSANTNLVITEELDDTLLFTVASPSLINKGSGQPIYNIGTNPYEIRTIQGASNVATGLPAEDNIVNDPTTNPTPSSSGNIIGTTINNTLTVFVSTSGSDTNTGLSLGSPVATLNRAIEIVRFRSWNGSAAILIAAGSYAAPTNIKVGNRGRQTEPLFISGSLTPEKAGTITLALVNPVDNLYELTLSGSVSSADIGKVIEIDGINQYLIGNVSGSVITLCGSNVYSIASGSSYIIYNNPNVTLNYSNNLVGDYSPIIFLNIIHNFTTKCLFTDVNCQFVADRLVTNNNLLTFNNCNIITGYILSNTNLFNLANIPAGLYINGLGSSTIIELTNTSFQLNNSVANGNYSITAIKSIVYTEQTVYNTNITTSSLVLNNSSLDYRNSRVLNNVSFLYSDNSWINIANLLCTYSSLTSAGIFMNINNSLLNIFNTNITSNNTGYSSVFETTDSLVYINETAVNSNKTGTDYPIIFTSSHITIDAAATFATNFVRGAINAVNSNILINNTSSNNFINNYNTSTTNNINVINLRNSSFTYISSGPLLDTIHNANHTCINCENSKVNLTTPINIASVSNQYYIYSVTSDIIFNTIGSAICNSNASFIYLSQSRLTSNNINLTTGLLPQIFLTADDSIIRLNGCTVNTTGVCINTILSSLYMNGCILTSGGDTLSINNTNCICDSSTLTSNSGSNTINESIVSMNSTALNGVGNSGIYSIVARNSSLNLVSLTINNYASFIDARDSFILCDSFGPTITEFGINATTCQLYCNKIGFSGNGGSIAFKLNGTSMRHLSPNPIESHLIGIDAYNSNIYVGDDITANSLNVNSCETGINLIGTTLTFGIVCELTMSSGTTSINTINSNIKCTQFNTSDYRNGIISNNSSLYIYREDGTFNNISVRNRNGINAINSNLNLRQLTITSCPENGIILQNSNMFAIELDINRNGLTGINCYTSTMSIVNSNIQRNGDLGINIDSGSNVDIFKSAIIQHERNYGMSIKNSNVKINQGTIENNSTGDVYGGIYTLNSIVYIENSSIQNNGRAGSGSQVGGIYAEHSRLYITNMQKSNNAGDTGIYMRYNTQISYNSSITGFLIQGSVRDLIIGALGLTNYPTAGRTDNDYQLGNTSSEMCSITEF
jgi:hypothetical protein